MPPQNLPEGAKKIYEAAEANARKTTCKDREDKDACAAKIAWSAVKKKYRKSGDTWVPKADVEFSLAITKSSFDKATNTMRWRAVASDTSDDKYKDNMTEELFDSFIDRIGTGEAPPEEYASDFWNGGNPYLSLAHYPDLNGDAVAGMAEDVFRDGNRLKALGIFSNTKLGHACFRAVNKDLYSQQKADTDKIRISIAFLDYKHRHKSNGFEFERKSLDEICPECVKEMILRFVEDKEPEGKEFLDGHLIHLALTRVPVNERTDILLERSMITQKEDALSIIGDEPELVEEIEQKMSEVIKSDALVVKSEEEKPDVARAHMTDYDDDDEDEDEENKSKSNPKHKKKSEVVMELSDEVKAYLKDLVEQSVSDKEVKEETPTDAPKPEPVAQEHILDPVLGELKATYDQAVEQKLDPQATLAALQVPMEKVGRSILENVQKSAPQNVDTNTELVKAVSELAQTVAMMRAQMAGPQIPQNGVPVRRSYGADVYQHQVNAPAPANDNSPTPKLRDQIRRSVGLHQ